MCLRTNPVPVCEILEAEIDILELLSYKPVFSRGYNCIMHLHTFADDCIIKDIITATEKDADGELKTKDKPKFVRSYAKARVRIAFTKPVPLEKFSDVAPLGRFTLRDEGKTIALGRVLRYKPVEGAAARMAEVTKKLEEVKVSEKPSGKVQDIVYDMETG